MSLIWIESWLQCGSVWLISAVNRVGDVWLGVVRLVGLVRQLLIYIYIYDARNIDEIIPHFLMSFLWCIVDMLDI